MKLWSILGNSQKLDGGAMFGNAPRAMWEQWSPGWRFDAAKSQSLSRNTPFDGWQFKGKVMATIVGGKIVYLAD